MKKIGEQMKKGYGCPEGKRAFDVLNPANITFTSHREALRCVLSI